MVVTEKFLNKFKTEKGGWNKDQLAALDEPWPPDKGWQDRAKGKLLKTAKLLQFSRGESITMADFIDVESRPLSLVPENNKSDRELIEILQNEMEELKATVNELSDYLLKL